MKHEVRFGNKRRYQAKEMRNFRIAMFAFGLFVILLGSAQLRLGVNVYKSFSRQDNWSIATLITGVVFMLVGLIPTSWVDRFVKAQTRGSKFKHR